MSNKESFIGHTVVYGLGAISLQLVSLVLLPLHTRYLPPSDYGLLQLLFRLGEVLSVCLMFQGIGLATLNFYKMSNDEVSERHIAASATFLLIVMTVVGILLALLFARPAARFLRQRSSSLTTASTLSEKT